MYNNPPYTRMGETLRKVVTGQCVIRTQKVKIQIKRRRMLRLIWAYNYLPDLAT